MCAARTFRCTLLYEDAWIEKELTEAQATSCGRRFQHAFLQSGYFIHTLTVPLQYRLESINVFFDWAGNKSLQFPLHHAADMRRLADEFEFGPIAKALLDQKCTEFCGFQKLAVSTVADAFDRFGQPDADSNLRDRFLEVIAVPEQADNFTIAQLDRWIRSGIAGDKVEPLFEFAIAAVERRGRTASLLVDAIGWERLTYGQLVRLGGVEQFEWAFFGGGAGLIAAQLFRQLHAGNGDIANLRVCFTGPKGVTPEQERLAKQLKAAEKDIATLENQVDEQRELLWAEKQKEFEARKSLARANGTIKRLRSDLARIHASLQ